MKEEKYKIKGEFLIEQIKGGKVINSWKQENTVVQTGRAWLLSMISGIGKTAYSGNEELLYVAVGNSDKSNDLSSDGVEVIDWRLTSEGTIATGGVKCRELFDTSTDSPFIIEDVQSFNASAVFTDDSFQTLPYTIKEIGVFISDTPPVKNPLNYDVYKKDSMFSRAVLSNSITKYHDGTQLRVAYKVTVSQLTEETEAGWYLVNYDGFNDCEEGRVSPLLEIKTDSSDSDADYDTTGGNWDNNDTDLIVGIDGGATYDGYVRFPINEIVDGRHYLRIRVNPDDLDDDEDIDIILIDSDNCPTFPDGAGNDAAYPESATYVTETFESGTITYTKEIDITTLYDAFTSRAGFSLGNYMGIKIKGSVLVGADNYIRILQPQDAGYEIYHISLLHIMSTTNIKKIDALLAEAEEFNPALPYYRSPIESIPSFSISPSESKSIGKLLTLDPTSTYAGNDLTSGLYYNIPLHQAGIKIRFRFKYEINTITDDQQVLIVANCTPAPYTVLGLIFVNGVMFNSQTAPSNHIRVGQYDILSGDYRWLTTQLQEDTFYELEFIEDYENQVATITIYDEDGVQLETEDFSVITVSRGVTPPTMSAIMNLMTVGTTDFTFHFDEIYVYRKPYLIP